MTGFLDIPPEAKCVSLSPNWLQPHVQENSRVICNLSNNPSPGQADMPITMTRVNPLMDKDVDGMWRLKALIRRHSLSGRMRR